MAPRSAKVLFVCPLLSCVIVGVSILFIRLGLSEFPHYGDNWLLIVCSGFKPMDWTQPTNIISRPNLKGPFWHSKMDNTSKMLSSMIKWVNESFAKWCILADLNGYLKASGWKKSLLTRVWSIMTFFSD